jgi:hypothetical protein
VLSGMQSSYSPYEYGSCILHLQHPSLPPSQSWQRPLPLQPSHPFPLAHRQLLCWLLPSFP